MVPQSWPLAWGLILGGWPALLCPSEGKFPEPEGGVREQVWNVPDPSEVA